MDQYQFVTGEICGVDHRWPEMLANEKLIGQVPYLTQHRLRAFHLNPPLVDREQPLSGSPEELFH